MSNLRQRMQEDMAVRGLAAGTQTVYLRAVQGSGNLLQEASGSSLESGDSTVGAAFT